MVDGNPDGGGKVSGDAGLLVEGQQATPRLLADCFLVTGQDTAYLELGEGETPTSADLAVVLNGRASHNRSQPVDGAWGDSSGLGLTSGAPRRLLPGLFPQSMPGSGRWILSRSCVRIPGRSGCGPVAASPCGSLQVQVSRCPTSRRPSANICGNCSRLFTSFWLCLIAWREDRESDRRPRGRRHFDHEQAAIPLCLLAIKRGPVVKVR